jgi:hypothetical protein
MAKKSKDFSIKKCIALIAGAAILGYLIGSVL